MKAMLVFKLPEEQLEHENALRGVDYKIALSDMREYLRKLEKYESDSVAKMEPLELLEKIRLQFHDTIVDLDI